MAVDEAIVREVAEGQAPPTFRLYRWAAPTVSLGYLQRTQAGVDVGACRRLNVPVVRRITGGRAVLHAHELTYSVALPLAGSWKGLSIPETFTRICRALLAGLRHLGVDATLGDAEPVRGEGSHSAACFLQPRMPAILANRRKLVGSAQRRWEGSVLQHGSLLLDVDRELLETVFPGWPRSEPPPVTSLASLLGEPPPLTKIEQALTAGWGETIGSDPMPGVLTPAELAEADRLARCRYEDPAWTFAR